jgi:hypothetical protein
MVIRMHLELKTHRIENGVYEIVYAVTIWQVSPQLRLQAAGSACSSETRLTATG